MGIPAATDHTIDLCMWSFRQTALRCGGTDAEPGCRRPLLATHDRCIASLQLLLPAAGRYRRHTACSYHTECRFPSPGWQMFQYRRSLLSPHTDACRMVHIRSRQSTTDPVC